MCDFKLSKKRRSWVGKRDVSLKGKPLNYNVSLELRYRRSINSLVQRMLKETTEGIEELFMRKSFKSFFKVKKEAAVFDASPTEQLQKRIAALSKKFTRVFSSKAVLLSDKMLEETKKSSAVSLKTSLKALSGGLALNTSIIPEGMETQAEALIEENVNLITSIPEKYFKDITGDVMRSISTGAGLADLRPQIQKRSGQTRRRSAMIARDQTRKAYSVINRTRMQDLGIVEFEWIHSGGARHPRKYHQQASGKTYRFDDLPFKGVEGFTDGQYPGLPINCGCKARPVLNFEDGVKK